jgi:uncharacterized protein involved in tolerance to divalent cations
MIRYQRNEINQKKKQIHFIKTRNEHSKQLISQISSEGIYEEDNIHLSDYNDSYSEKVI